MFPDPDRDLAVDVTQTFDLPLTKEDLSNPDATRILLSGLARTAQIAAEYADRSAESDWRIQAYRDLCRAFMENNHEGTGSAQELWVHKTLEAAADLLGVKQR